MLFQNTFLYSNKFDKQKNMIICEVGLNHFGDINYANEYVEKIIRSNADAILFHMREKSFYNKKENKMKILPESFYINTIKKVHKKKLKFGITLADADKISFCESIGVDFYKILSHDIQNFNIIQKLLETKKPIFISTGFSDIDEINITYNFIKKYKNEIKFIHTQISPELKNVNLKSISMLRKKFNMKIAFGNHCNNPKVLFLSLAYEPSDLFFYVKGNKRQIHQDESHAIELKHLKDFVSDLKILPQSIGTASKIKSKHQQFLYF